MRFYQSEGTQSHPVNTGSGIGLHLVKGYMDLHKGEITVESTPGKGTCFTLLLPAQPPQTAASDSQAAIGSTLPDTEKATESPVPEGNKVTVLVAEDNEQFRTFMKDLLGQDFTVLTAADGQEGLAMAREYGPDLIISDVMMPRMNGYELCKNIKEDITISHIPIVLLTARDDKQSQLSGYKNGADAYLTKPFEMEMLMEIIRNRLKNRESIKKRYLNTGLVPAPEESTFSQADETFLLKLNKIILEHLDSSHLDVTFICKEIGMSRASLYNKLKALTDMGANDYINKFRMEKAITLITSTDLSFTEIAEKVGFTTSRYFSTAFKQYTGETPTQYKEKRKQEKKNE